MAKEQRGREIPPWSILDRHLNEWVTLLNGQVVSHDPTLSRALAQFRELHPTQEPFVLHLAPPTLSGSRSPRP